MLSCKEIARLLSTQEKKSWMKRAELRMHLFMCKHCSAYAAHLDLIKSGFLKLFHKITEVNEDKVKQLEDEVIEKIKKNG